MFDKSGVVSKRIFLIINYYSLIIGHSLYIVIRSFAVVAKISNYWQNKVRDNQTKHKKTF